ncbi:hypothetical protein BSU04_41045 [Caballeronia sordidicola]|uniref:Uncharacterized protein n=1 Tax=Caballeronia sordidicola TaxID=196367 RepID=A0A226WMS1_CABSO|nr:hypothetical protein BSU04_41045 [Caballeronia sordidicola]
MGLSPAAVIRCCHEEKLQVVADPPLGRVGVRLSARCREKCSFATRRIPVHALKAGAAR